MRVLCIKTALVILLAAGIASGQSYPRVAISAPGSSIIVGGQMKLEAVAWGIGGVFLGSNGIRWSSDNESALRVDSSGMLSAVNLGIASIRAQTDLAESVIQVQALPLRIDVIAPSVPFVSGSSYKFQAIVRAADLSAIDGAQLRWEVTSVDDFQTSVARIDSSGEMTAVGWGRVAVHAVYFYANAYPPRFVMESRGRLVIDIAPETRFRFTKLLSSADRHFGRQLRVGSRGEIAANDRGQIAFLGTLDGVAGGVLVYDNGQFALAAGGGLPTPLPGGIVSEYSEPSLNEQGQFAVAARASGQGAGLLFGPPGNPQFVVFEGDESTGYQGLHYFSTHRDSLNANGDILFTGRVIPPGETQSRPVLLLYSRGAVRTIWDSRRAMPDGTRISEFWDFGLADDGTAYFVSGNGPASGVYRVLPGRSPEPILRAGDAYEGGQVGAYCCLRVAPEGDAAFLFWVPNQGGYVGRFQDGKLTAVQMGAIYGLFAASRAHGVLFDAEPSPGRRGLYRWSNSEPELLWRVGARVPGDGFTTGFASADITPSGKIIARASTSQSAFVVLSLGSPPSLLFRDRDPVPTEGSVFLQGNSLISGSRGGPPRVTLGSPESIYSVTDSGLRPEVLVGDSISSELFYSGLDFVQESRSGDLYFGSWQDGVAVSRLGQIQALLPREIRLPRDERLHVQLPVAINERGTIVFIGDDGSGGVGLYRVVNNGLEKLAAFGQPLPSVSPSVSIAAIFEMAVDERDRVMAYGALGSGWPGYLLHENGSWRLADPENDIDLRGQPIGFRFGLRALDETFYAGFHTDCCEGYVAKFVSGRWQIAVSNSNGTPLEDQGPVGIGQFFDVNRAGQVAFHYYGSAGESLGILKDGIARRVAATGQITPQGDLLRKFGMVDLRDDGSLNFTAVNLRDEAVLYRVEEQTSQQPPVEKPRSLPPRARHLK